MHMGEASKLFYSQNVRKEKKEGFTIRPIFILEVEHETIIYDMEYRKYEEDCPKSFASKRVMRFSISFAHLCT